MKKGITPVIAMIILILIGVFATWMSQTFFTMSNSTTEHTKEILERFRRGISIDNVHCVPDGNVTIRNSGSVPLDATKIMLYVNDTLVGNSWRVMDGGTEISKNGLATQSGGSDLSPGVSVKITAGVAGEFESLDEYICK